MGLMNQESALTGHALKRSIIYGSLAVPIKKPDSDHTHKWTVYVKGYNGEDISYFVKRVSFKLHESFAQPIRCNENAILNFFISIVSLNNVDIEESPFEVNETGWGEFQIQIKIFFQDPIQRPVTLNHHLRLYPPEDVGQLKTSKPVLSEFYDELLFEPATEMMEKLIHENDSNRTTCRPHNDDLLNEQNKEIAHINSVIDLVNVQLVEVNDKLSNQCQSEDKIGNKK